MTFQTIGYSFFLLDIILEFTLILIQETENTKADIIKNGGGTKGEERTRRAGSILNVASDGYNNTEKCVPDFVKVSYPRLFHF